MSGRALIGIRAADTARWARRDATVGAGADAALVVGYLALLGLPFAIVLLRYALVA